MVNFPGNHAETGTADRISSVRLSCIMLILFALFFTGYATVGRDFPSDKISRIHIGETTKEDIRVMFGPPWRTGFEGDGTTTWTYGKYEYELLQNAVARDLVVRFDKYGMVYSYTYNTTKPSR